MRWDGETAERLKRLIDDKRIIEFGNVYIRCGRETGRLTACIYCKPVTLYSFVQKTLQALMLIDNAVQKIYITSVK